MKKLSLFLLSLLLLLSLCACGKQDVYDVEYEGRIYTVDTVNSTVTFDGHVCGYKLETMGESVTLNVTYPDGSTYFHHQIEGMGMGGGSVDYNENRYVPGEVLWEVLDADRELNQNKAIAWGMGGLVLIPLGIFYILRPRAVWTVSHGWLFKDAEPSDAALLLARLSGVVLILLGLFCFLYCFALLL